MKYNISEILGLAGSGKSTTVCELKHENNHYIYEYNDYRLNIFLLKNLYLYFKVYYKSKKTIFTKSFILFHIFLYNAKKEKISVKDVYVFDQGPIFTICMLIHEIPSMREVFLLELKKILPYYKNVIYLEAPFEIISSRIKNRKQQHRIKNVEKEVQKKFLNKYSEVYNSVLKYCIDSGIRVIKIDTHEHSVNEVKAKINEIIQTR